MVRPSAASRQGSPRLGPMGQRQPAGAARTALAPQRSPAYPVEGGIRPPNPSSQKAHAAIERTRGGPVGAEHDRLHGASVAVEAGELARCRAREPLRNPLWAGAAGAFDLVRPLPGVRSQGSPKRTCSQRPARRSGSRRSAAVPGRRSGKGSVRAAAPSQGRVAPLRAFGPAAEPRLLDRKRRGPADPEPGFDSSIELKGCAPLGVYVFIPESPSSCCAVSSLRAVRGVATLANRAVSASPAACDNRFIKQFSWSGRARIRTWVQGIMSPLL